MEFEILNSSVNHFKRRKFLISSILSKFSVVGSGGVLQPRVCFSSSKLESIGFGICFINVIQVYPTNGQWSYNV